MTTARKMPAQRPGSSKQDVGTPREFLDAVERRFGPIRWDLAAHADNHVVPDYLGPGSPHGEDALKVSWLRAGLLWLNPEFNDIAVWAAKAAAEGERGARVVMLTPASVSSEWFAEHVENKALVLPIRPRLVFVGEEDPYPKDLMISVYGPWIAPGFRTWRWK